MHLSCGPQPLHTFLKGQADRVRLREPFDNFIRISLCIIFVSYSYGLLPFVASSVIHDTGNTVTYLLDQLLSFSLGHPPQFQFLPSP